jgi:hypothetical protein
MKIKLINYLHKLVTLRKVHRSFRCVLRLNQIHYKYKMDEGYRYQTEMLFMFCHFHVVLIQVVALLTASPFTF